MEAKIIALERGRSRRKYKRDRSSERTSPVEEQNTRRLRRKSLDSATSSEPLKILMRLTSLETKVTNVNGSTESLNVSEVKSDTLPQEKSTNLESIISSARCKLKECFNALMKCKSGKERVSSPSTDRLVNLEKSLNDLNYILNCRENCIGGTEANVIKASAGNVVKQMVMLLNDKLTSINEKRRILKENGQITNKVNLELLAEKIAFENILIGRIQSALSIPSTGNTKCERLLSKEAIETRHLIANLQEKLNGCVEKIPPPCKTSAEYLTKILAEILINSANGYGPPKVIKRNLLTTTKFLQEEQAKLNTSLTTYKISKLPQLAEALALEAMNLASDSSCSLHSLDKKAISDTWKVARETVNFELIQSEINHILMRTAQIYESNSNVDNNFFFSFFASERAALELWCDSVENFLQTEMEKNIQELTEMYKNALNKLQRQNWRRRVESERSSKNTNMLLCEFADIIAHKALIDAKINVLIDECDQTDENDVISNRNFANKCVEYDKYWNCLQECDILNVNQNLEVEFKCLLKKYSRECESILSVSDWIKIGNFLNEISVEMGELLNICGEYNDLKNIEMRTADDVCEKCQILREKLKKLKEVVIENHIQE